MVKFELPKLASRVRFPSPAPSANEVGAYFNGGNRTRKGMSVKRKTPAEFFVANGPSHLKEMTQDGVFREDEKNA